MKKVRGLDLRADVIFSVERGHSDGRFGIKDGRSVSQSSINVSLLRDKKRHPVRNSAVVFCVFLIMGRGFSAPQAAPVGGRGLGIARQILTEHSCARPGARLAFRIAPHCCIDCALHKRCPAKRQTEAGVRSTLCWPSPEPRWAPTGVPMSFALCALGTV